MRGSNHNGMRQFNERIVLRAIRHAGAIPKADLARLTQLSTQTVSIIVNRLLEDKLLIKQERIRGKIGQAHARGLGRRQAKARQIDIPSRGGLAVAGHRDEHGTGECNQVNSSHDLCSFVWS